MDTPSPDELDHILGILSIASHRVAQRQRATASAFATERAARERLFERIVTVVTPALANIAEVKTPEACFLELADRKGKTWHLGLRGDPPDAQTFVAVRRGGSSEFSECPVAEALAVIALDEMVCRIAVRLRASLRGLNVERCERAHRLSGIMDAVAVLLRA